MVRALAGVFARKQLNLVPALDLERDFMATIQYIQPDWEFGIFQDIDEFFKAIFQFFPDSIANSIGFVQRRQLSADDGSYIINAGNVHRSPMITINLPETPIEGLGLQDLIFSYMSQSETISYTIDRGSHPLYFTRHGIDWGIFDRRIEVETQPKVLEYADVVPIFIARRTQMTGSNSRDFRKDKLDVPESILLPLHTGQNVQYTLVSFAVYHPGHYFAYGKSYPSTEWFLYNDETVQRPDTSNIINELERNAVMLFYVKTARHVPCQIPVQVEKWAITSLIVQHLRSNFVDRVKKMVKKAKKADKKKSK